MTFITYAQNLEDVMLYRALKHVKKGFYIDIGAQDPVIESVTKSFYELGWNGINVDPMDEYYLKLKNDRPRDINLKLAVSLKNGSTSFYSFSDTGLSTMNEEYARKHAADNFKGKKIDVQTKKLDDICTEYDVKEVHFLKIDVEGAEGDVIRSFSFDKVRPWILVIEATEPNSTTDISGSWHEAVLSHGYIFVYFDGLNRYYVAKEHDELKKFFVAPPNVFDNFIRINELELMMQKVGLENELNNAKDELNIVQLALKKIQNSQEWKIGLILQKVVKKIIPKGSNRRNMVVGIFRIFNMKKIAVVVKKGFKSLIYKTAHYIILKKTNHSSEIQKKKLLIDCSFVYNHQEVNTGIQRVVNNIIKNIDNNSDKYDIQISTVIMLDRYLVEVDLQKRKTFLMQNVKTGAFLSRIINSIERYFFVYNNVVIVNSGDILLMLDSSWEYNISPVMQYVKKRKGVVLGVAYDLIPIKQPQFCDEGLVDIFSKFYSKAIEHFDGFISISKTVMSDLQEYIDSIGIKGSKYYFDYFILGSDFKKQEFISDNIRREIIDLYPHKSVYLTVSTIEPRKNQAYLVDSFEKLWEKGVDVKLCIIGRIGWKTEELIERIKSHKEFNKRLFMFNDATDAELSYCYNHAKMLVFASFVEGFGLPIIESLNNGLPVLASDIPIHREVGENAIEYFDLNNVNDLANKINVIEKDGLMNKKGINSIKTKTWKESSAELLEKVMKISDEIVKNRNS